jgi:YidC/Oxa1 family membrane protein insertase
MSQTRSLLFIAWLFVAGWLWLKWTEWNTVPAPGAVAATTDAPATPPPAPLPTAAPLPNAPAAAALPGAPATAAPASDRVMHLSNDVLELDLDAHGNVVGSRLLDYRQEKRADSPNVSLLQNGPGQHYVATAGFIESPDGRQQSVVAPELHPAAGESTFRLAPGAAAARVTLTGTDPRTGLSLTREISLPRGAYALSVKDTVANTSARAHTIYPFVSLERNPPAAPKTTSFFTNPESLSFVGAAWYSPDYKFKKTPFSDFTDETPEAGTVTGGWIGMLQHHFVTAWIPRKDEPQTFATEPDNSGPLPLYRIKSFSNPIAMAPGSTAVHEATLWVGPKLQAQLEATSPGLNRALDYGIFTFIAQPLFDYVLKPLHALTGNWGWAIILTVLLLKLLLYPLSAKQYKSMAKMRAIMPRIEALKERYGEDRQAFAMAQMDLYKKEGVNPIGGCLPVLIPLPIFFALYWVLLETVELRHAPWMGWIQNLTAPDPYFILPALNMAVMFITQKMTPTPGMDPVQKKMMTAMPLVFGVMMAFFPAGLVLYWVSNGILGIAQQWWITRQHGPNKPAAAH